MTMFFQAVTVAKELLKALGSKKFQGPVKKRRQAAMDNSLVSPKAKTGISLCIILLTVK